MTVNIKDKEHVILGEAALNLVFGNEEVTTGALIRQLDAMAVEETDEGRLAAINAASRWLADFRQPGRLSQPGSLWLAPLRGSNEAQGPDSAEDIILLRPSGDDKPS